MKTKILKWDVMFQEFMIAANILFVVLAFLITKGFFFYILIMQFIGGAAQLTGSGIHLRLQHKSLGFAFWRRLHFYGSLIYLATVFILFSKYNDGMVWFIMFFLIPQVIFYAYFFLCFKELRFLQSREFHILR